MNQPPLEMGWMADSLTSLPTDLSDVNAFEEAVIEKARELAKCFYAAAFARLQQKWLEQNREEFAPERWRTIRQITPLGELELPTRVVRRRGAKRGGYLSLNKVLLGAKATKLLSPAVEKCAVMRATHLNYRPAARSFTEENESVRFGHGLVWKCVQAHGRRLERQLSRGLQPEDAVCADRERARVVTEVDSGWIKQQCRGRKDKTRLPARGFWMHLSLHYTGRQRRWEKRGSREVELSDKSLYPSVSPMAQFGPMARRHRDHHYGFDARGVILSDGDEGLERLREKHFPGEPWVLDRWHIDKRLKAVAGENGDALRRMRRALYRADSEALLEELAACEDQADPKHFAEAFGYVLGNREGIDAWKDIPKALRTTRGRREAAIKFGTGGVEKNIEVFLNRRFKGQGRSWNPKRAGYLAGLRWLYRSRPNFERWWKANVLQKTLNQRTQPQSP